MFSSNGAWFLPSLWDPAGLGLGHDIPEARSRLFWMGFSLSLKPYFSPPGFPYSFGNKKKKRHRELHIFRFLHGTNIDSSPQIVAASVAARKIPSWKRLPGRRFRCCSTVLQLSDAGHRLSSSGCHEFSASCAPRPAPASCPSWQADESGILPLMTGDPAVQTNQDVCLGLLSESVA